MKDNAYKIKFKDKEYPLVFNLNVMEQIQEEYGTVQKWGDLTDAEDEPNVKAVLFGLMVMINEGLDIENEDKKEEDKIAPLTKKQVGRMLTEIGLAEAAQKLNQTVTDSIPTPPKNE